MQLCDAFDLPILSLVRHAGHHGRPRGREDRPRAPLQPHVPHRRQSLGAVLHHHPAQGLRPRRHRHGRRLFQGALRSRSPGRRASSAPWAWKARCKLGYRAELAAIDDPEARRRYFEKTGRRATTARARRSSARHHVRHRRHHRPRRVPLLAREPAGVGAAAAAPRRQEARRRSTRGDRSLVTGRSRVANVRP